MRNARRFHRAPAVTAGVVLALAGSFIALAEPRADDGAGVQAPVPGPEQSQILRRVAFIGASASAGFNLATELGERRTLAGLLGELLRPDDDRVILDAADELVFMDPPARGTKQIDRLEEFRPTAVVGIDFLFWYAYGPLTEMARTERFERGLERLAKVRAPLVVGDLPDMRTARTLMLPREFVPTEATLARLNQRLAEWADGREHVTVLPLSEWMRKMREGEALELRDERWDADDTRGLLQWDGLHPSLEGSLALLALALDALDRHAGGALARDVDWQVRRVAERLLDDADARRR